MTSTDTRRTPRAEWIEDAWKLRTEGNGDGTGGWTLARIAAQRGLTVAGVSKAFKDVYGEKYTNAPKRRYLPWTVPECHLNTTTGRRLVLLAKRELGQELTAQEHGVLTLFLQRIPDGYVVSFDPDENRGRGAWVFRPRADDDEIVHLVMAVKPGDFED